MLFLLIKKERSFITNLFKAAFYGLDTEPEPEHNLSKVETGTGTNK
jgi:hypothetical protein